MASRRGVPGSQRRRLHRRVRRALPGACAQAPPYGWERPLAMCGGRVRWRQVGRLAIDRTAKRRQHRRRFAVQQESLAPPRVTIDRGGRALDVRPPPQKASGCFLALCLGYIRLRPACRPFGNTTGPWRIWTITRVRRAASGGLEHVRLRLAGDSLPPDSCFSHRSRKHELSARSNR